MLRVYSIIYIEKLWNTAPTPILKDDVSSLHSSTSSLKIAESSRHIAQEVEQEEEENIEEQDIKKQDINKQLNAYIMENDTAEFISITDNSSENEEKYDEAEKDENNNDDDEDDDYEGEDDEEGEDKDDDDDDDDKGKKRDSKISEQNEQTIKALDITQDEEVYNDYLNIKKIVEFKGHEDDNEGVTVATSLSSGSSIVPPSTPGSITHSTNNEKYATPKTTSLLRRETNKFNDRRKSLTKKLKKALAVKSSGPSKRNNSV